MTRTIFGRRQAVLRQRARQEAWRLALREEIETRTLANERPVPVVEAEGLRESRAAVEVVAAGPGAAFRLRDPRD
jgi:hypothetical protein